jgi:hypothetical protein
MKTSNAHSLGNNLKTILTTGGVFAAGATVHGEVVHTDISDISITVGSSIYFNLLAQQANTDALQVAPDHRFELTFGFANAQKPFVGSFSSNSIADGPPSDVLATQFSAGQIIDSSLTYVVGAYMNNFGGDWTAGERGFLGLRLDATGSGGFLYGWADVSYNVDQSLTLHAFAVDNSSSSIPAGTVPEPSTGALAALFAGSVAAYRIRQRRKAEYMQP